MTPVVRIRLISMRCLACLFLAHASAAGAQVTTAFTYQGVLEQAGGSAQGNYDIEFTLFDAAAGGVAFVGPVRVENVPVSAGLFATEVDFGMDVFGVIDLWLEIGVREAGTTGGFDVLTPRQKITPAPLALHAQNVEQDAVGSAQIADGSVGVADVNTSEIQARVAACAVGSSIRSINADGSVVCQADSDSGGDITEVAAGSGLAGGAISGSAALAVDPSQVQSRVTGTCSVGQWVRQIGQDGSVVCQDDPGGDITAVLASDGLTGGASNGAATLAVDTSVVQSRVSGSCPRGTRVAAIDAEGGFVCEEAQNGISWLLDDDEFVGYGSSIAVRQNGRPIISYTDLLNNRLKVFSCSNVACSSGMTYTLIEGVPLGERTSIAIRGNGYPIVSYNDRTNGDLRVFDCADADCSFGTDRILDSSGNEHDIAVRPGGNPVVAYSDTTNGTLKLFDCNDSGCSSGTDRMLDNPGGVNSPSIAFSASGNPVISYVGRSPRALKLFQCGDSSCSLGTAGVLDESSIYEYTSIAMRSTGSPIVAYVKFVSTEYWLYIFNCDDPSCTSGGARVLSSIGLDEREALSVSIAIRSDDLPIISYYSDRGKDLKIYPCMTPSCDSTVDFSHTLESRGDVGEWNSIAIRESGNPIISYFDASFKNLKVFSCGVPDCLR